MQGAIIVKRRGDKAEGAAADGDASLDEGVGGDGAADGGCA
jgi:hypothetical protein